MTDSCSGLIAVYQVPVHPLIQNQVTLVTIKTVTFLTDCTALFDLGGE